MSRCDLLLCSHPQFVVSLPGLQHTCMNLSGPIWQPNTLHLPITAPQTSKNKFIIYGLRRSQQPLLPVPVHVPPTSASAHIPKAPSHGAAATAASRQLPNDPRELTQLEIYVKEAVPLPHGAAATALCGDARGLVVGFEDGRLFAMNWNAQVCRNGPCMHGACVVHACMVVEVHACTCHHTCGSPDACLVSGGQAARVRRSLRMYVVWQLHVDGFVPLAL